MFLEPLSICSCRFTNILFITHNPGILLSVDHPVLCDGISVLESLQVVLHGSTSFNTSAIFSVDILQNATVFLDLMETCWRFGKCLSLNFAVHREPSEQ